MKIKLFERRNLKSSNIDNNMLGIYLPKHILLFINLLALTKSESIQNIPRLIISEWYMMEKEKTTINSLISDLTKQAQSDWDSIKTMLLSEDEDDLIIQENFTTFKKILKVEFKKRNIPIDLIKLIINKIKYEAYENATIEFKKGKFK